jgi:hypothetical protein
MHPLLVEMSARFDRLETRVEIVNAISELEDAYDSFSGIEQETASTLIEELNRRHKTASP